MQVWYLQPILNIITIINNVSNYLRIIELKTNLLACINLYVTNKNTLYEVPIYILKDKTSKQNGKRIFFPNIKIVLGKMLCWDWFKFQIPQTIKSLLLI